MIISDSDSSMEFLSSLFFSMLFSRITNFAQRSGGQLPVTVNCLLDEFCNIGSLKDFKRTISTSRIYKIYFQLAIQSLAQLSDRYPKGEWEEILGDADYQVFLGCNDMMTANYISSKIGVSTVRTETNQKPLTPLFSPINNSTRSYSQSTSNTQRPLLQPDEVLKLDNRKCLLLCRGQQPIQLYKIIPDEFPHFQLLQHMPVADYIPEWRSQEETQSPVPQEPEATASIPLSDFSPSEPFEDQEQTEPPSRQQSLTKSFAQDETTIWQNSFSNVYRLDDSDGTMKPLDTDTD